MTEAGQSIEDKVSGDLQSRPIVLQNAEGWGGLVPGAALAEAICRYRHGSESPVPKPVMYVAAAVWDCLKLAVWSGAILGIYTGIERLQQSLVK